jgi:hypothetical protein
VATGGLVNQTVYDALVWAATNASNFVMNAATGKLTDQQKSAINQQAIDDIVRASGNNPDLAQQSVAQFLGEVQGVYAQAELPGSASGGTNWSGIALLAAVVLVGGAWALNRL